MLHLENGPAGQSEDLSTRFRPGVDEAARSRRPQAALFRCRRAWRSAQRLPVAVDEPPKQLALVPVLRALTMMRRGLLPSSAVTVRALLSSCRPSEDTSSNRRAVPSPPLQLCCSHDVSRALLQTFMRQLSAHIQHIPTRQVAAPRPFGAGHVVACACQQNWRAFPLCIALVPGDPRPSVPHRLLWPVAVSLSSRKRRDNCTQLCHGLGCADVGLQSGLAYIFGLVKRVVRCVPLIHNARR